MLWVMWPVSLTMGFDGCEEAASTHAPVLSSKAKQAIFERLLQRQHIRRQLGIRPLNITTLYWRKVQNARRSDPSN